MTLDQAMPLIFVFGMPIGILFIYGLIKWASMPPAPPQNSVEPRTEIPKEMGGLNQVPYVTSYPKTKNEIFEQIMADAEAQRQKGRRDRQDFWDHRSRIVGEMAGIEFDQKLDAAIQKARNQKNPKIQPPACGDTVEGSWREIK